MFGPGKRRPIGFVIWIIGCKVIFLPRIDFHNMAETLSQPYYWASLFAMSVVAPSVINFRTIRLLRGYFLI